MAFVAGYKQVLFKWQHVLLFWLLLVGIVVNGKEGYDAKTGKWIGKRPSKFAFAISPETYQRVKNWYATDSGTNNPNNLPITAPREGYTYIYTPYKDPAHPDVHGMSIQGENGYKGYWYADDLTKATDSLTSSGDLVQVKETKDNSPKDLEYGGYDARTGKWLTTKASTDAFTVSYGTYQRVKNWYATNFGADNPLGLPIEAPREDFTYLYVPFSDPKHPGVIGMSFQGDGVYRGYWYADKIPSIVDSIFKAQYVNPATQTNQPTQNSQPSQNQQQTNPPPIQAAPTNNSQQQSAPPQPNNANQAIEKPNN